MEQFGKELEKVLKAGIGAVSTGLEKGSEVLEKMAQKGEPLYQQAKDGVCSAAEKIKKAVDDCSIPDNLNMMFGGKVTVSALKQALKQFSKEELDEVHAAINELYENAPEKAASSSENEAHEETPCLTDGKENTCCCSQKETSCEENQEKKQEEHPEE